MTAEIHTTHGKMGGAFPMLTVNIRNAYDIENGLPYPPHEGIFFNEDDAAVYVNALINAHLKKVVGKEFKLVCNKE
jgi:hypothetical protein